MKQELIKVVILTILLMSKFLSNIWLRTYFAIRFIISLKFLEITLGQKIYEIYLLERSGLGRIFSIYHAILKKR